MAIEPDTRSAVPNRPDIDAFLQQFQDTTSYYLLNPGNAGDSLIAHGTFQVFERLGVPYHVASPDEQLAGKTVFIGGGGNLVPMYSRVANRVRELHDRVERLVILPHTIAGHADLLNSLGSNVDIICRDFVSYDYVSSVCSGPNVYLMDDLALEIDVAKTIRDRNSKQLSLSFIRQHAFRNSKRLARSLAHRCLTGIRGRETAVLNAFRTDVSEMTDEPVDSSNFDLSAHFSSKDLLTKDNPNRRDDVLDTAYWIFLFLNRFAIIRTNRLHVCIAAALLGKEVQFFPNSYWKNYAVFRTSMETRFPLVRWMGEEIDIEQLDSLAPLSNKSR